MSHRSLHLVLHARDFRSIWRRMASLTGEAAVRNGCKRSHQRHPPLVRNGGIKMKALDLRGLSPAPVTPFTLDGAVDFAAIQRLGSWLGSIDGVKSLVVLGHAGEGTFMTQDEQAR